MGKTHTVKVAQISALKPKEGEDARFLAVDTEGYVWLCILKDEDPDFIIPHWYLIDPCEMDVIDD